MYQQPMQNIGMAMFRTRNQTTIIRPALILVAVLNTVWESILDEVVGMSDTLCRRLTSAPDRTTFNKIMPENRPIVRRWCKFISQ